MPSVIWSGESNIDGQTRTCRVVRRDDGGLAFEVKVTEAAMGEPIWHNHEQGEVFPEFLVAAGNEMHRAQTKRNP